MQRKSGDFLLVKNTTRYLIYCKLIDWRKYISFGTFSKVHTNMGAKRSLFVYRREQKN